MQALAGEPVLKPASLLCMLWHRWSMWSHKPGQYEQESYCLRCHKRKLARA